MALWTNYLTNKMIYENHPSRIHSKCLAELQHKHPCTLCKDVCPQGVFDDGEPNWTLCDNCGVCVSICPSRCLCPSSLDSGSILEVCGRAMENTTLSCRESSKNADLKLPCLSAYPWELIALFAVNGQVTLSCGDCETCDKKDLLVQFANTLDQLSRFLGTEAYASKIHMAEAAVETVDGLSLRAAFGLLFSKSKATVAGLLPEQRTLIPDGTLWRQILVHKLKTAPEPVAYHWEIPEIFRDCTVCGLCTKLCPAGALHKVHENSAPNQWHLALIPWRCVGCGLCTKVCPVHSLSEPKRTALTDPSRPIIHTLTAEACIRCGDPIIAPNSEGLCERCQGELGSELIL